MGAFNWFVQGPYLEVAGPVVNAVNAAASLTGIIALLASSIVAQLHHSIIGLAISWHLVYLNRPFKPIDAESSCPWGRQ
jgi:hypothetical protein